MDAKPLPSNTIRITEDGEAIGTLRQFATNFGLPPSQVVDYVRQHAPGSIILHAGEGLGRVLIIDAPALNALRRP